MIRSTSFLGMPLGADIRTSPFFTIRIDSLLVRLYVTCIAISIKKNILFEFCYKGTIKRAKNQIYLVFSFFLATFSQARRHFRSKMKINRDLLCILLAYSYLCSDMEFFQTLGKGIVQGFNQFITNDLESYIPLFIIAAVLIIAVLLRNWIHKHK